ncbi:MAG: enoyl-[acyl-carrier protein] reductase I [Alphaproteobacteria bacterium]|jgi:enoyl-[acyl-carrier protein] reductase I
MLFQGKKGLIVGVANDKSIAWGIAKALHAQGAEIALTYQGDAFEKRVRPLAQEINAHIVGNCDAEQTDTIEAVFKNVADIFPDGIDFFVHAIAFSDKSELKGYFMDTTKENFLRTMNISCYSLVEMTRYVVPMMKDRNGSILTLSYLGAERVVPNYNVMGVAKSALESSVRYLAHDLGDRNIRVNAVSAGPMRTLAGSAIGSARAMYAFNAQQAPLKRNLTLEEVGNASMFLLSDLASGITGEIMYVDAGYNTLGVPRFN